MYKSITVVTATFNAEETVGECLRSVNGQTVGAEHLIMDGVSGDNTLQQIALNTSENVTLFSGDDDGLYDAMNKGIVHSSGDIIGILNADDFYPSSTVLEQVARVFEDDSIDGCYGDLLYVDAEDTSKVVRYWKSGDYSPSKFYWGWMPPHPTFFVRRSVYERFGVFSLDMGSAADYELMLRFLLKHQINVVYIPEVLVHMRTGGVSNSSMGNRLEANKMDRKAWEVNDLKPYPWTLLMKPLRKLTQWFARP